MGPHKMRVEWLPEALDLFPQLRPGQARRAADEDVRVIERFLILNPICIGYVTCHPAIIEEGDHGLPRQADDNNGLRRGSLYPRSQRD